MVLLLLLALLVILPVAAYRWAKIKKPEHVFLISGAVLGVVASPLSTGLYACLYIPIIGPVLGIVGLVVSAIHSAPGFYIAVHSGLINGQDVMKEVGAYLVTEIISALVWSVTYGAIGYFIDRMVSRSKRSLDGM